MLLLFRQILNIMAYIQSVDFWTILVLSDAMCIVIDFMLLLGIIKNKQTGIELWIVLACCHLIVKLVNIQDLTMNMILHSFISLLLMVLLFGALPLFKPEIDQNQVVIIV